VRHQLASEGPFDVTDKFRIDIYIDKKLVGRKQVLSTLVRRRLTAEGSEERSSTDFRSVRGSLAYLQLPATAERQGPTATKKIDK